MRWFFINCKTQLLGERGQISMKQRPCGLVSPEGRFGSRQPAVWLDLGEAGTDAGESIQATGGEGLKGPHCWEAVCFSLWNAPSSSSTVTTLCLHGSRRETRRHSIRTAPLWAQEWSVVGPRVNTGSRAGWPPNLRSHLITWERCKSSPISILELHQSRLSEKCEGLSVAAFLKI